jgi:Delta6-protoilludene synthase
MYEKDMTIQQAAAWFNEWNNAILSEFLVLRNEVDQLVRERYPSDNNKMAEQVCFYVDGLAKWIRGSDDWHFEGERHFGSLGREIRETKEVYMLPRVDAAVAREGIPAGVGGDAEMIRQMMERSRVASLQIEAVMAVEKPVGVV